MAGDNTSDELLITPIIEIEEQRQTPARSAEEEYVYEHNAQWEIAHSNIVLGRKLGEGAFGCVMQGHTTQLHADDGTVINEVAVKMLKKNATEMDVKNLVYEMEIMKILGKHINIVSFLGCCSQNGALWVITEYLEHGNLKDFLQKHYNPLAQLDYANAEIFELQRIQLTEQCLIEFAYQIARGMNYLISKRCIHRDLAARNILVSSDLIMKIADFGFARDLTLCDYYRKDQNNLLPVKWMAPETLEEPKFTSATDVWSFGVLLWEIMSYGRCHPYGNVTTIQLLTLLHLGDRLTKPENCPDFIYSIMLDCWNIRAEERPSFHQLECKLNSLIENSSNVDYVQIN